MNSLSSIQHRILLRLIGFTASTFIFIFALCPSVFAATPTLNTNLLINPDAESGTTSGWVCPDRQWVSAAEITPHGGNRHFWPGGGDVADTSMYQDVDVSGLASSIAAGTLYMHLSGWLANWDQYPHDRATLALYALDATGNTLAFLSSEHRSPVWTQYRMDKLIPAGTKTLRVVLRATRFVGTDDDGYFDDLSLVVNNTPGITVNITSPGNQSYVTIGGATLTLNATTVGGTDSGYDWSSSFQAAASVSQSGVVTGLSSGRATIQARGRDTGAIGAFDVSVIVANGLVFIEPSANKTVAGGTTSPVTWSVVGTVSSAVLYLSMDGGVTYSLVSNISNPASGAYNWAVPAVSSDIRNAILKLTYSGGESLSSLFSIVTSSVNGVCGSSNGGSFTIAPTANLCASGTASAVTGNGPWSWTCSGINSSTNAACSANVQSSSAITPSINYYHQSDGKVSGLTTNGSTVTGGAQFYQEANAAWSIVGQGDFDGDGVRDLVWWNSRTGQVYIMLMATTTAVKGGDILTTEPDSHWRIVATGDINGDGKSDLIWWHQVTGQVYAMLVNGTAVAGGGTIFSEPNTTWKIVAAADFNGNGKVELLWWNNSTGQVAIGQTNGTSASTANLIWTESNTDWRIVGAGDLDDDGKSDIIWHNRTTGQVYGMQTNGSSVTNGAMMYTEPNTYWEIVSVGNYNSDKKADLLWWNQLTGQVYLMPMNGLSVAPGASLLYTEPDTAWRIQGETEWRDNLYGRGVTTTTK